MFLILTTSLTDKSLIAMRSLTQIAVRLLRVNGNYACRPGMLRRAHSKALISKTEHTFTATTLHIVSNLNNNFITLKKNTFTEKKNGN